MSLYSTINVPKGMMDANAIKIKCFLNHLWSNRNTITSAIYAIKRNPCGMPSSFTSDTSPLRYFKGTPTNSNRIYDKPSRKAMTRNMVRVFIGFICMLQN